MAAAPKAAVSATAGAGAGAVKANANVSTAAVAAKGDTKLSADLDVDLSGTYRAWRADAPNSPLRAVTVQHVAPADDEVLIRIHASGICYTDIDALSGRHAAAGFTLPIVPGHEGVGTVVRAGRHVPAELRPGTRVGVGCFRGACHACARCSNGHDNLCAKREMTYALGSHGTFAEFVRIRYQWAVPVPDAVPAAQLDAVAPLFCAGATVFSPLTEYHIKAGSHVAVLGVGGLGHLAIQFAAKWGCEVTAISSDKAKEKSLRALGAHHFVDTKADPELKTVAGRFDALLLTVSGGALPWDAITDALAPGGKLVLLGLTEGAIPISAMKLIFGQKSIVGVCVGSTGQYHQMIQFAALHGIVPTVERFHFDDINTAVERVKAGTVRYRAVVNFTAPKLAAAAAVAAPAAAAAPAASK